MPNSILTLIQHGNCHRDHFALGQAQITVTMHEAVVESHQGPQGGQIEAMRFDDIIDTPPGTLVSIVDFGNDSGSLVFFDIFNPHICYFGLYYV